MISLWVCLVSLALAGPVNDELKAFGFRLKDDSQWTLSKNSVQSSGSQKVHTLQLESPHASLEFTVLDSVTRATAESEAKIEYASIMSAYQPATTPYAGAVSKRLGCAPAFAPKDIQTNFAGQKVRAVIGFASQRKAFGACEDAEAALEFAYIATGLPGGRLVKLTAFRKREVQLNPKFWSELLSQFSMNKNAGAQR